MSEPSAVSAEASCGNERELLVLVTSTVADELCPPQVMV